MQTWFPKHLQTSSSYIAYQPIVVTKSLMRWQMAPTPDYSPRRTIAYTHRRQSSSISSEYESMESKKYIELEEQYGAHNYHPLDVVLTRGDGVWVFDIDGNRYLDCLSAYSALNQGHVHPKILQAMIEQAGKITLTSRAFRNDQLPFLYKELSELTSYEMSLPMNSGAEAVETAIKLARKWAYNVKNIPRY